jgi:diguanylate cyclase (GGDEF)-like protein
MSVNTGKLKKLFKALFITNICVFSMVFVMTVIGSARITSFNLLLHAIAGVEGIIAIITIISDFAGRIKNRDRKIFTSDSVFSIGLLLFMMLAFYDIFMYYHIKYYLRSSASKFGVPGFTIGSLIFVAGLLISYLLYIIYNANIESMQTRIASLAYSDPLTGLANRARCQQVMEILSKEHGTYSIISLDLNKLKPVNDTLGHQEGDRLLSGFATILSDCFIDANLVGRMGGDEFIVIFTEDRAFNCTKRIHELYAMISDWNHKETKFQYSTSYGYAYSYEVPSGSAQEVYMLADSRMYEMKKEHRGTRGEEVQLNA